jgi:putative transposase
MPRKPRIDVAECIQHVINRANDRVKIFHTESDYQEFEELLVEACERSDMRLLAYALMPNHWHLAVQSKNDGDVGRMMHWLTTTHSTRVRVRTETIGSGHVYQGRYKSFLVETDNYLLALIKYVERNPVRAKLVSRAEDWRWGSAYRRIHGTAKSKALLAPSPTPLPHGYRQWVNTSDEKAEIDEIRESVNKSVPYGSIAWRAQWNVNLQKMKNKKVIFEK